MTPEEAEEFTQALGDVISGGMQTLKGAHRQRSLAVQLGVPKSLGMTTEEWITQRNGGYAVLPRTERREAVIELRANGHSQRETAEILGVDQKTISRDEANASQSGATERESEANASPITPEAKSRADKIAPRTQAERDRIRAESEAAMHRQRNIDLLGGFNTIDSLRHPHVLAEVIEHYQPLSREWTAEDVRELGELLIQISNEWKVR